MTLKQASTVQADRYAFTVHLLNGSKKPDLKRSFIRVYLLGYEEATAGQIELEDRTVWTLYLEPAVIDSFKEENLTVKCIISFQSFFNGNGEQIAVARLYRATVAKRRAEKQV